MLAVKPGINFRVLLETVEDAIATMSAMEQSVGIVTTIIAALQAGKMPVLTAEQLAQLASDETKIEKLVSDIKALVG